MAVPSGGSFNLDELRTNIGSLVVAPLRDLAVILVRAASRIARAHRRSVDSRSSGF